MNGSFGDWLLRNRTRLLAMNILCLTAMFIGFLSTSTFKALPAEILPFAIIAAAVPAVLIIMSLISGGLLPVVVSILGVVLITHAVIQPIYIAQENALDGLNSQPLSWPAEVEAPMDFGLGVAMVLLGTIIVYRPTMLFTKNRPNPVDDEWLKIPVWKSDESSLASGLAEPTLPVRDIMSEQDRRLLWRYEYVLARIGGTVFLVKPSATVPVDSTELLRDRSSGKLMGKARFAGYFM